MIDIYIARHGITESNKKKIYMDRSEEGLSQEEVVQAEDLGRSLRTIGIKRIYSSPIQRAFETAQIAGAILKVSVEIEEDLKEMELGSWVGLTGEEVSRKFPDDYRLWDTMPRDLVLPDREPLSEVQQRALKAIAHMKERSEEVPVLGVTHVALIRCLILHYHKMDLNRYRTLDIPNASVFLLRLHRDGGQISRFI